MFNFKRILSLILAVAMVASMAAMFTSCGDEKKEGGDSTNATVAPGGEPTPVPGEKTTYTVSVKALSGMALSDLDIYVYADDTLTDMVNVGKTDANGLANIELPAKEGYAITVNGAPAGYEVKESYSFTGTTAVITLASSVIKDKDLSNVTLGLGDIMVDFTVETSDGESFTLSEVLKEKKMVMLNFWYTTCSWCLKEFPFMEEAYQMYGDDVEIIALNPMNEGNKIAGFKQEMGLSFPMASCPTVWSNTFGIQGYPTSVVVDRYGVICLIESGGITSLRPFTSVFEHFSAVEYEQKICEGGIGDLISAVKPNVTMESSDKIAGVINGGDIEVTYRPETEGEDAEYSWPFVITDKNGTACVKASNSQIEGSYAIMYADVTLKKGQAVGIDYLISSERGSDVMHVIVNDEAIYQISGVSEKEEWKTCYPVVAEEDGTYEIAFCYIKDDDINEGEDTVYLKNIRVVSPEDIDTATYLPKEAATSEDGDTYKYVDIFLNEKDGYYHVGSENGPLLLAGLTASTQFSEENTLFDIVYNSTHKVDGVLLYDAMVEYFTHGSNSAFTGFCTVNEELAEFLKIVDEVAGFDSEDDNEWLKACRYYNAYGTGGKQLEDPIKGLAPFSAYKATEGKNQPDNNFYYDRVIMPRGYVAEFVPSRSGVYRITSRSESEQGVNGWIFSAKRDILTEYEGDERMFNEEGEVSMLLYMEAGTPYYIDIAYWDVYEVGYIYYDVEYIAPTYEHFRACSPGPFTSPDDDFSYIIAGGIKAVLKSDGYYYEDLGKDADGNQRYGSLIYADFTGVTLFSNPITTVNAYDENGNVKLDENGNPVKVKGMIEMGGFDFSKTENDLYILGILDKNGGDVEATELELKSIWGEDYDANWAEYQVADIFAGKYHGQGGDCTEEIKGYLNKIQTSPAEKNGCVPVDKRLAEILQLLMDKYTFENVDQSWLKLCFYYDYLGPDANR